MKHKQGYRTVIVKANKTSTKFVSQVTYSSVFFSFAK